MEVLERVGTPEQKAQWLQPLLDGEIRSCFGMTEPDLASSDARNIATSAVLDGDEWVINGEKYYISGAGDPRCKIMICMVRTSPDAASHLQQSQILVPMDTPGVEIVGPMLVFGHDDAPHGHMHLRLTDVRVPKENILLGEGRGFEISQLRLGPGRIHHCMRSIGAADRALQLMVERGLSRQAFGKPLIALGKNTEVVARARIEIEAMRLMVLRAAKAMDLMGNAEARVWVSAVKAMVPERVCQIIDEAIQIHGATGVSQWTPLADMYTGHAHPAAGRRPRRGAPHGRRAGRDRPLPAHRLTSAGREDSAPRGGGGRAIGRKLVATSRPPRGGAPMPSSTAGVPDLVPQLSRGKHRSPRKGACFMELASYLAGERWSDRPSCTHPLLAALARLVNDHTTDAGRGALAPLVPSVIGLTSDDPRVDVRIALRAAITALPVAAAERQRVLAVSILAARAGARRPRRIARPGHRGAAADAARPPPPMPPPGRGRSPTRCATAPAASAATRPRAPCGTRWSASPRRASPTPTPGCACCCRRRIDDCVTA